MSFSPKKTRQSFSASNFTDCCFICDENNEKEELHTCSTKDLNKHVWQWTTELGESKVIAKLSEGDMVAIERKYHKKCLTSLYNRFRKHQQQSQGGKKEAEILRNIEGELNYFLLDLYY